MATRKQASAPNRFARRETISVPDFQFDEDHTYYVKFMTAFVRAQARDNDAPDAGRSGRVEARPMEPPIKARLMDMETGEIVSAIIPAMVRNHISEAFPGDGYVSRCFEITVYAAKKPKKYKTADIYEIDDETGGQEEIASEGDSLNPDPL